MEYHQSMIMTIPSGSSCSWLVGCHVGHTYSWLRNSCAAAASARWPALLPAGWEVRTRVPGGELSWQQDAVAVEPVRGGLQTWQRWVTSDYIGFEYNTPFKNLLLHWSRSVNKFIVIFMIFANQTANWHVAEFHMETTCLSKHRDGKKHYKTSLN